MYFQPGDLDRKNPNDECPMTKEIRSPNDKIRRKHAVAGSHSCFVILSDFDIGHSTFTPSRKMIETGELTS